MKLVVIKDYFDPTLECYVISLRIISSLNPKEILMSIQSTGEDRIECLMKLDNQLLSITDIPLQKLLLISNIFANVDFSALIKAKTKSPTIDLTAVAWED